MEPGECFKYVVWDTMNCIGACKARVDQILTEAASDSLTHSTSPLANSVNIDSTLLSEPSWVDDPMLEKYAQTALDSNNLAINALNFASDRVCDVLDLLPPSDLSEDLRVLHDGLLDAYPDYRAFVATKPCIDICFSLARDVSFAF